MQHITESDLVKFKFDCSRLHTEGGFNEFQLRDACFDAADLKQGD